MEIDVRNTTPIRNLGTSALGIQTGCLSREERKAVTHSKRNSGKSGGEGREKKYSKKLDEGERKIYGMRWQMVTIRPAQAI